MKKSLVMILTVCAAAPAARADLFSTKAPRGESRAEFVSPGNQTEVCIVPKAFPGLSYSDKDLKEHKDLCFLDFYGMSGENKDIMTAVCPKLSSTNPGTEIEEVNEGSNVATYVAKECVKEDGRAGKKIAKFKQSISCSYTPSILGYYQVAQALGGSIEVPETVIRTMDIDAHKKVTAMGVKNGKDTILLTWKSWAAAEASPKSYSKRDRVFTEDFQQIYGALSKNPRGEAKYSEINAGLKGFSNSAGWANVRNSAPISKLAAKDLASAGQKIIQMKDITNMLVIDYIMAQQDRFGNIHSREMLYSFDGKNVKKRKRKHDEQPQAGETLVKELMLKDNDCGLRADENVVKKNGMLQAVRHMAPKNYKKLMEFANSVRTPEVASYFGSEMLATSDDVKLIQKNAAEAAKILQDACKAGNLKLDLDLEGYLNGKDLTQADCL